MYQKVLELAIKLKSTPLIVHAKVNVGTSLARDGEVVRIYFIAYLVTWKDKAENLLEEVYAELKKEGENIDLTEKFRALTALASVKEAKAELQVAIELAYEAG